MNGDWLVKCLVAQYAVIACVYGWQGNWPKMLYWIGAGLIGTSVVMMK